MSPWYSDRTFGQEMKLRHKEKDVEMICGYSFWESGQPDHW